jgi:hypothetical protein
LQQQYKVKSRDASAIGLEIRSWAGVMQYPSEFEALSGIAVLYAQLPVYVDGLLC